MPVPRKTYKEVAASNPMNPYYDTPELHQMSIQSEFENQPSEREKFGDASEAICFQASGKKDSINLAPGTVIKYNFTVKMPSTWNPRTDPASGWNIHLQGFASDGKKNHFYSELCVLPVVGTIPVPSIGEVPPTPVSGNAIASTSQAKLFCRHCGKELRLDSKFCDGCGQQA